MAYADDLRQKLLQAVDTRQASQARLAEIFGVSLSWLKGIVRRRRETGNPHALPHRGGKRPKLNAVQREALRQYATAHDDLLLRQLQAWVETTYRIEFSLSSLSRLLTIMNLARKKSHSMRRSVTPSPISRSGKLGVLR
jgi:transposase